jgi:hypothetical protein
MKKIYIPSNLDLPQLLDQEHRNETDIDRLHYIINLIYEQRALYKNDEEFVQLKAIYMRRLIGRAGKTYNDYINILANKGIIECDRRYIVNEKSFGYKLCNEYSDVRHKQVPITSASLQSNIERWQDCRKPMGSLKEKMHKFTKVHKHIYHFIENIEIDYKAALQSIEGLSTEEYNKNKITIDKIKDKEFYLHRDEFGRIHTNLTILKSTLRRFLSYKGKKFVNIDVVNSQPLLLLLTIKSIYLTIRCTGAIYFEDVPPDVLCYKRLVERGELYEYLMKRAQTANRDNFKENFFRDTFFGKKTSNLFCELFPTIGKEIRRIKRKDYRRLAWMMQRKESKLIITKICGRIMREHPEVFIGTIHDSVLTTPENVSTIRQIMSEEFEKIGLSPTIRVDRYE